MVISFQNLRTLQDYCRFGHPLKCHMWSTESSIVYIYLCNMYVYRICTPYCTLEGHAWSNKSLCCASILAWCGDLIPPNGISITAHLKEFKPWIWSKGMCLVVIWPVAFCWQVILACSWSKTGDQGIEAVEELPFLWGCPRVSSKMAWVWFATYLNPVHKSF